MARQETHRCRALLLLLGVVACVAATTLLAPAAQARLTLSQLQNLLTEARGAQRSLDRTVARLDANLNVIGDKLAGINERIATVTDALRTAEVEYDRLHARLTAKKRQLQQAEQELAWRQSLFEQRVAQMYKAGEISYLDVLLQSTDYEDMLTRVRLIRSLVEGENTLVGDLADARDKVAQEKRQVAEDTRAARKVRDEVRTKRDELATLRADQLAAQESTREARSAKKQALAKIERNIRVWEAQEAQLAAESQGLAGVINGLAGNGDGKATGSMIWPCPGPVTSGFGWRVHPIFHVRKFHTGIDIGAGYGTPIKAADGGRVIYATWMSGYGNATIIDHGGGITTLYAHQSRLLITSGSVTRGQVVGYVGSTGYSTGPHLHFEVRVNGNPVNPMGYLH